MPVPEWNPGELFVWTFALAAVAGLAALLRSSDRQITYRIAISSALNPGLFGMAVAMIWWEYFDGQSHPWLMPGVSTLLGLGGVSMLDHCLKILQEFIRTAALNSAAQVGQAAKTAAFNGGKETQRRIDEPSTDPWQEEIPPAKSGDEPTVQKLD